MQQLSSALTAALVDIDARVTPRILVDLVELYDYDYIPGVDGFDPADAIETFAAETITWNGIAYRRELMSRSDITRNFGEKTNSVSFNFSNISRYLATLAQNQEIEGLFCVIRCVCPSVTDDSITLFVGRCDKPSDIDKQSFTLTARQDFGNINQEIPPRTFTPDDPEGRTPSDLLYEGFRLTALQGSFSIPVTTASTSFFGRLFGKKKTENQTRQWSSLDATPYGSVLPMVFGRCQMEGIPIQFADIGYSLIGVWAVAEGRIDAISNVTIRDDRFTLATVEYHYGDPGGTGSNATNTSGPINQGYLSKTAYLVISIRGSEGDTIDESPTITQLVRGTRIPIPSALGVYDSEAWSDNPVNIARFILTDPRLVGIDEGFMEDSINWLTALHCDEPLIDDSNGEVTLLPSADVAQGGTGIRRFRSTGLISPRYFLYNYLGDVSIIPEEVDADYTSYDLDDIPTTFAISRVLRSRYTFNAPITDKVRAVDFLYKTVFPSCKGFLRINKRGKYEIRSEQSSDATMLRSATAVAATSIPVLDVMPWKTGPDLLTQRLLLGFGLTTSEVRNVSSAVYSTSGNSIPLDVDVTGGVTAEVRAEKGLLFGNAHGFDITFLPGGSITTYLGWQSENGFDGVEPSTQVPLPDLTVETFSIRTISAQPGTGSLVLTVRKQAVGAGSPSDTSMQIVIPAGSAAGTYSDSQVIEFAAGDLISVSAVNNAASNSAQVAGYSMRTSKAGVIQNNANGIGLFDLGTQYLAWTGGDYAVVSNELYAAITMSPCAMSSLRVRTMTAQGSNGPLIFKVLVSGDDTLLVLTIPANSPAGVYTSAPGLSASVFPGDYLSISMENQAAAQASASLAGYSLETNLFATPFIGSEQGLTVAASTTSFLSYGLYLDSSESLSQIPLAYGCELSGFTVRTLSAQPGSGSLVLTVRKNGVNTALTITIAAGSAAGVFTDLVNTVAFADGDLFSILVTNSASAASAGIGGYMTKGLNASSATLGGGTSSVPASGTVTIGGSPGPGDSVTITIDEIETLYTLNGDDTVETTAAMLAAYINGNPQLHRYITAVWDGADLITISSKHGTLTLDSQLLKAHAGPIADPTTTPSLGSSAGALLAGAYKLAYADITAIGQTALSPQASITIIANKKIDVGAIALVGTSRNWYMSDAANSEHLKFVASTNGSAFSINALPLAGAALAKGYNTTGEELIRVAMSFATNSQDIYPAWAPGIAALEDTVYLPTTPNGHKYEVLSGGLTGTTEPTWPTGAGATVSEPNVDWAEAGATVLGQAGLTRANIVKDSYKWPLNKQSSVNQAKTKYRDSKNDFALTPLLVNDRAHQAQVHKTYPIEVDLSAVDNFNQAFRLCNWTLAKNREGDWFNSLETGPQGLVLEEGDVICSSDDSGGLINQVTRIEEIRIKPNHNVAITQARRYSTLMFADEVGADTIPVPSTLRYTQTVDSIAEIIDNFPIRDADALIPAFYIVVSRDLTTIGDWRGWVLYADYGDGYLEIARGDIPAIMGVADTTLASVSDPTLWDDANDLDFTLQYGPPSPFANPFATVTKTELAQNARRNLFLVGDEYIQAATIVDNGDQSYTISNLLRGRFGTDTPQFLTHGASERVIYLDGSEAVIPIDPVRLDTEYSYKVVTTNQGVADATAIPFAWSGGTVRPLAPVHITGLRDAGNNLFCEWRERSRMGQGMSPNSDVPLAEESRRFKLDWYLGASLQATYFVELTPTFTPFLIDRTGLDSGGAPKTLDGRYVTEQPLDANDSFVEATIEVAAPTYLASVGIVEGEMTQIDDGSGGLTWTTPWGPHTATVDSTFGLSVREYGALMYTQNVAYTGDTARVRVALKDGRIYYYLNASGANDVPLYVSTLNDAIGRDIRGYFFGGPNVTLHKIKRAQRLYFCYSADQQTADGFTPGNLLKVRIMQLSAIAGAGDYQEATI